MNTFTLILFYTILLGSVQAQDMSRYRDVEPLFEGVGHFPGARFGRTIAGIGDQNGDGYNDILVVAEGELRAYLFYGGNPMDTIPDMIFKPTSPTSDIYARRVASAGDVNGDGFIDFLIREGQIDSLTTQVNLYFGGDLLDSIPDLILSEGKLLDGFGSNFRSAGDVNGDGYDDILINSSNFADPLFLGRVYLYFGGADPDSIADWVETGDTAKSYLGVGSMDAADINRDGYNDIILGSWRVIKTDSFPSRYSYINVYFGGVSIDTIPSVIMDQRETEFPFGSEVSFVGDLDGDSFVDFVMPVRIFPSPPPPTDSTWVWVFNGAEPIGTKPFLALMGGGSDIDNCLCRVRPAGDINGDGYSDIIVGDPGGWGGQGQVLVYLGGPNMDGIFDIGFTGFLAPWAGAGIAIDWVGDVNGDGVDDIFFGAHHGTFNPEGRAVIYSGDSTLVSVIEEPLSQSLIKSPVLHQNYPNPFNPITRITYELYKKANVELKIFNILGHEVTVLVNESKEAGAYSVTWEGKDKQGLFSPSGIYILSLKVGESIQNKKIILLK